MKKETVAALAKAVHALNEATTCLEEAAAIDTDGRLLPALRPFLVALGTFQTGLDKVMREDRRMN